MRTDFLAKREGGREFTANDEETLVMFAAWDGAAQDRGCGVEGEVESTDEAGMPYVLISVCPIPVTYLQ